MASPRKSPRKNTGVPEIYSNALSPEWILFQHIDPLDPQWTKWKKIPEKLQGYKGETITLENGEYHIRRECYEVRESALFAQEITVAADGVVFIGFAANFFLRVWINGELIADFLEKGNPENFPYKAGDCFAAVPLRKGKNILTVLLQSGSNDFAFYAGDPRIPYNYYLNLIKDLEKISWKEPFSPARLKIEHAIRKGVEKMRLPAFETFDNEPYLREYPLKDHFDKYPVLIPYEDAMSKLLREVPQEQVTGEDVAIWHLYNMGYVIKTAGKCFGIDLHHRRAELLEPYLDFVLVTHNHSDHQNLELLRKMRLNGKQVFSNFYPAPGYGRGPDKVELDDITIYREETDHNAILQKFVQPFLIRCGKGKNALTIYHTGDSRSADQLAPALDVDIYILHPRVGLKVMDAVRKFRPRWVFFSHLMEMGHTQPSIWRPVNYKELLPEMQAIREEGLSATIPLWGEKILWTPGERKGGRK